MESASLEGLDERNRVRLDRVRSWLVKVLRAPSFLARERCRAGWCLGRLGDPREELRAVDRLELCRVPQGAFRMGEGRFAHDLEIGYPLRMGRFPVTVSQFREFVAAGGYGESRFWPEAATAGVWSQGRIVLAWADETRDAPARFGEPFDLANHPAVGVTWYEALAFCRWLTARWRESGALDPDWEVRLPSEAEWEKAARGGEEIPAETESSTVGTDSKPLEMQTNRDRERRYPWEGGWSFENANVAETLVSSTSAVGCFPSGASPYGCEEMSGNVWEWTRSVHREYPYDPRDGRESLAAQGPRVLRGGSWISAPTLARCAVRDRGNPDFRLNHVGFRVVLSPFFSDL